MLLGTLSLVKASITTEVGSGLALMEKGCEIEPRSVSVRVVVPFGKLVKRAMSAKRQSHNDMAGVTLTGMGSGHRVDNLSITLTIYRSTCT